MRKKDRWVLVTGGSRGIGKALVTNLSHEYDVVFTYANSEEKAQALTNSINAMKDHGNVIAEKCDVRDIDRTKILCSQLIDKLGPPYGIICNAGITRDDIFLKMSPENWYGVIDNNLNGAFGILHHMVPHIIQEKCGSIIFMSSIAAIKGVIGQTNYSASKAAMLGFSRSLARELSRFKITVNAILPGFVETDMTDLLSEQKKDIVKSIPLRRFADPIEIYYLVDYLLSDKSRYITGQEFVIDGGLTI